jgi:hypothetical protein
MKSNNKKYTTLQKITLGLITLIFVGLPIGFWAWIAIYLL